VSARDRAMSLMTRQRRLQHAGFPRLQRTRRAQMVSIGHSGEVTMSGHQPEDTSLRPAFAMWNPLFAGMPHWNAEAQHGLRTAAGEWQEFVGHRLQEDFHLMQRLTRSSTPDEIMAAYTDYWNKAADEYGKEVTTMTKLMVGVTNRMVSAAHSAAESDENMRRAGEQA
jgi:hypothetical protein